MFASLWAMPAFSRRIALPIWHNRTKDLISRRSGSGGHDRLPDLRLMLPRAMHDAAACFGNQFTSGLRRLLPPAGWEKSMTSLDSFKCARTLKVGSKTYVYYSLPVAEKNGLKGISRLPFSLKVLLENLLRNEDGRTVTKEDIQAFAQWLKTKTSEREIAFRPARVLMQDFTGVPAVVDLAAMRDAMEHLGGDPKKINPLVPVDLVIDHSVAVTFFGNNAAFKKNVEEEYKQNQERYRFLKWAQRSFEDFRVVPPGTGICHQVNLEYLSQTVWTSKAKAKVARQDRRRPSSPIRTRWSAPIRTPPWSTDCRCSAGASAASRRRPRCSASPIRWCCRR